ncbi:helix-turn-helix domain-containing protein [Haloimpatiens sp. FM7330]|uniref:helix-turn-helix domain-containing protein n=1 Tax=Haloimpatiens sp. FM7330 TaxID=3298610 RepID=UPI0036328989
MSNCGYIVLDKSILDMNLSGQVLKLYCILESYCFGKKNYCFPSQKTLSLKLGKSVRTIQRYLKILFKLGIVKIKRRGSISNLYILPKKKIQNDSSKDFSNKEKFSIKKTVKKIQDKCAHYGKYSNSSKRNAFNNYPQRNYDISKLEEALLGYKDYTYEELLK